MSTNPLGDREIVIKFTSTARLLGDSECAPTFFHDWEGRIVAEGDPDLSPAPLPEIFIGSLKLMYADVEGMINAGKSLFSYFDAFDERTSDYFFALFDTKSVDWSDKINPDGDVCRCNLLILDRLEIVPEYRGANIGLLALNRCMQRFIAGTGIVVLKAFPLQFEDDGRRPDLTPEEEKECDAGTGKLEKYYAKLGFKKLKGTEFMIVRSERWKDVTDKFVPLR